MKFNISDETHNSFLQLESFLKVVSRSVSMVLASVSALTIVTSYPSFSRANIENIVPISLKETVISNKHTRRINFCVDDIGQLLYLFLVRTQETQSDYSSGRVLSGQGRYLIINVSW